MQFWLYASGAGKLVPCLRRRLAENEPREKNSLLKRGWLILVASHYLEVYASMSRIKKEDLDLMCPCL